MMSWPVGKLRNGVPVLMTDYDQDHIPDPHGTLACGIEGGRQRDRGSFHKSPRVMTAQVYVRIESRTCKNHLVDCQYHYKIRRGSNGWNNGLPPTDFRDITAAV